MALNCRRHDCFHNDKEGECFARTIFIDGTNAKMTAETSCGSYTVDKKGKQDYEFANEFIGDNKLPSDMRNIECAARNCKFNENTACIAPHVEINFQNASCETFEQ